MDRVSCPDTKIRVLSDLGVDVDRVSCPDMENQECCLIRDGQREMRVRLHQKFNVSRTFGGSSQPNTNEGLIIFQNKEDESHFHTLSSFDYLQEWRKVKIMVNSIK